MAQLRKRKEEIKTDIHIGRRVRLTRMRRGIGTKAMGKAVGVTFQQIQKYESGVNRVSCSTLFSISHVLEVPVAYFFEGLDEPAVVDFPGAMTERNIALLKIFESLPEEGQRDFLKIIGIIKKYY